MRERISTGTRLMGAKEFLHSRMAANAVEVSRSSWETVSKVKLQRESENRSSSISLDSRRRIGHALQLIVESEDEL